MTPRTREALTAADRSGSAAAAVLLASFALARVAATLVPAPFAWSLDVARDLPSAWAAVLLAAPLVALAPPIARALERSAAAFRPERRASAWAAAFGAVTLAWLLPDRAWFTGDYLGRQFSLDAGGDGLAWYTHAMPLDRWLHQSLGHALVSRGIVASHAYGRWLGAFEIATLATIAIAFARALGVRGLGAAVAAMTLFWGGGLALFTGYNKALSEAVVITAAFAALGVRVARTGRGLVALSVVLALGLALHRSLLGLVPAWVWAWRAANASRAERRAAAAIPLATLALLVPALAGVLRDFDLPIFLARGSGFSRAAWSWRRFADLANALLLLVPAAPALLALAAGALRARAREPEARFLAWLAAPLLALAFAFYPPEGLFRFWDVLAAPAIALAAIGAWAAARACERPDGRRVAPALALTAACAAFAWLLLQSDAERSIARVRAYAARESVHSPESIANAREYLGFRLTDLGRDGAAALEFERAAAVVPSPRVLRQWAATAMLAGDRDGAARVAAARRARPRERRRLAAARDRRVRARRLPRGAASARGDPRARAVRFDRGAAAARRARVALALSRLARPGAQVPAPSSPPNDHGRLPPSDTRKLAITATTRSPRSSADWNA